jgi:hypothetical protein
MYGRAGRRFAPVSESNDILHPVWMQLLLPRVRGIPAAKREQGMQVRCSRTIAI